MKQIIVIFLCCARFAVFAQTTTFIAPYPLEITSNKTTNLIFPFAVQNVDRGSADVLVQKAAGTENILHVKAGRDDLEETNLTVITTDGKLYSFLVDYNHRPQHLNIVFSKDEPAGNSNTSAGNKMETGYQPAARFVSERNNAGELQNMAQKVITKKKLFHHIKDDHASVKLQLKGLYVSDDIFYFQFAIHNQSNVSYVIDAIRFSVRDKRKAKRTATQETELASLYQYGVVSAISGKQQQYGVIAIPKFTLPDNQYLDVHVLEKNGGRDLQLKLKNRHLMKAKPII